jgi:hypothetical protein
MRLHAIMRLGLHSHGRQLPVSGVGPEVSRVAVGKTRWRCGRGRTTWNPHRHTDIYLCLCASRLCGVDDLDKLVAPPWSCTWHLPQAEENLEEERPLGQHSSQVICVSGMLT